MAETLLGHVSLLVQLRLRSPLVFLHRDAGDAGHVCLVLDGRSGHRPYQITVRWSYLVSSAAASVKDALVTVLTRLPVGLWDALDPHPADGGQLLFLAFFVIAHLNRVL